MSDLCMVQAEGEAFRLAVVLQVMNAFESEMKANVAVGKAAANELMKEE